MNLDFLLTGKKKKKKKIKKLIRKGDDGGHYASDDNGVLGSGGQVFQTNRLSQDQQQLSGYNTIANGGDDL